MLGRLFISFDCHQEILIGELYNTADIMSIQYVYRQTFSVIWLNLLFGLFDGINCGSEAALAVHNSVCCTLHPSIAIMAACWSPSFVP